MLYGCLFDLLRLLLLGLALLCVLLFGATLWLGPDYRAFVPVALSPDVQWDVDIRGPSPDFDLSITRHVLFRETFQHIISIHLRAYPLAMLTILLSLVTWAMDWYGWQRQARR